MNPNNYRLPGLLVHFDETVDEPEKEAEKDLSLTEAVEKAAEEIAKGKEKKEEKAEEKKEEKKEEKEEEEDDEEALSDEELLHAKNLFKLLKNPETNRQTLETLVKAAGINEDSTKKEVVAAKKTIKEILKEKLPEYGFLAESLGSVLEEIFKDQIAEGTKEIRERLEKEAQEKEKDKIKTVQEKVISDFVSVPDSVILEMDRILKNEEFIPAKNSTPDRDFRILINMAAENKKVNLVKKDVKSTTQNDRRDRNRTDADSRLASERSSSEEGKKKITVHTLSDAVEEAAKQVAEAMGKK